MALRHGLLVIAALSAGSRTVVGGVATWTTGGPSGGARRVATDVALPGTIYTEGFVSTDNGSTWEANNLPLDDCRSDLAVGAARTVYVLHCSRVLKSVDGAMHWTDIDIPGAPCALASAIETDPVHPATLFLASDDCPAIGTHPLRGEVWKSTDGGATWAYSLSFGLGDAVTALALDPASPSILYALGGGISEPVHQLETADGGQTWSALPVGFGITAVTASPASPRVVYAAGLDLTTFAPLGLFKSTDGGHTFLAAGTGLTNLAVSALVVDPHHPGRVYASTGGGVFASADAALHWTPINDGLTDLDVRGLALDPSGTFLHAATASGVFDYEIVADPVALTLVAAHPFRVTVTAIDHKSGHSGSGFPTQVNDIFGYFSLPAITGNDQNPEIFVKILDGSAVNGKYWVFTGGLTSLEYTLKVTDAATGASQTYTKETGSACGAFDTEAFPP